MATIGAIGTLCFERELDESRPPAEPHFADVGCLLGAEHGKAASRVAPCNMARTQPAPARPDTLGVGANRSSRVRELIEGRLS